MLSRANLNDSLFAGGPSWAPGASQIEVLISRACNPSIHEPNYALNLEVADHINQKKANTYVCTVIQDIRSALISLITSGQGKLRC